jgi:hypothetical protein
MTPIGERFDDHDGGDPRERFEGVVAPYLERPRTEMKRMMRHEALTVDGRIAAMFQEDSGSIVVKIPAIEASVLVEQGVATQFENGKGQPMKEWVVVPAEDSDVWAKLVGDAFEYVGAVG